MDRKEPFNHEDKDRLHKLIDEVNSKENDQVSTLTRALLTTELAKEALNSNKITLQECIDFANSLIDFNAVPVIIGTPEKKIFPVEIIIKSRPAMIENTRKFVARAGINLDQKCQDLKIQAQNLSDLLELGYDWVERNYGLFKLSPEQMTTEIISKVKNHQVTKDLFSFGEGKAEDIDMENEKKEAVDAFIKLNFSNFIVGQNFLNYIKRNYQLNA